MVFSNKLEVFHSAARRTHVINKLSALMREKQFDELRTKTARGKLTEIVGDDPDINAWRHLNVFPMLSTPDTLSVTAFACDDEGDPLHTWRLYFEFGGEDITCMRLGSEMVQDCPR